MPPLVGLKCNVEVDDRPADCVAHILLVRWNSIPGMLDQLLIPMYGGGTRSWGVAKFASSTAIKEYSVECQWYYMSGGGRSQNMPIGHECGFQKVRGLHKQRSAKNLAEVQWFHMAFHHENRGNPRTVTRSSMKNATRS